jgi:hypothetical protein
MFSHLKKSNLTAYSSSHQAVLPKPTFYNLLQISTSYLFIGISLEKNEMFVNLLVIFFQSPMSPHTKFILYNLFPILIKFQQINVNQILRNSIFYIFNFTELQNSLLNSLFQLTSSCPSKNYFLQSFPDFYPISFHGYLSGEK